MIDYIGKKMIVDTRSSDGGAYFEKDYFEWRSRNTLRSDLTIRIKYSDVKEVRIIRGRKKRVEVYLNDGTVHYFWLYKAATFAQFINAGKEAMTHKEENKGSAPISDEDLERLSKLSSLHKDGVLSEEEFQNQKEEILNKYR